jgi:hypothetical protein
MTPRLSPHARSRCEEMGIPTKDVKRLVQAPSQRYGDPVRGGQVYQSQTFPTIAALVREGIDGCPVVVTVLWRTAKEYDRATYRPDKPDCLRHDDNPAALAEVAR